MPNSLPKILAEQVAVLKEKWASLEHDRWGRWQSWMHGLCTKNPDGSLTIPANLVERWNRQIDTKYPSLSEQEKDSDREQVVQYLIDTSEALTEAYRAGQQDPRVGFLRQYLNECGKSEKLWTDEQVLGFLKIPFLADISKETTT